MEKTRRLRVELIGVAVLTAAGCATADCDAEARRAPGGVVRVQHDLGELVTAREVAEETLCAPGLDLQRLAADGGGGRRPAADILQLGGERLVARPAGGLDGSRPKAVDAVRA